MRNATRSTLVIMACAATILSIWLASTPPAYSLVADLAGEQPSCSLGVTLREGSCIRGVPVMENVEIEAAFGKVMLPFEQISRISFEEDEQKVVVALCNGDRLTGKLDWPALELTTVFGRITIPRKQLLSLAADGVTISGDRHRILFTSESVRRHFTTPNPAAWKIENKEFVCRSSQNRGDENMFTYKTSFRSIDSVLIRGRVMQPYQNFRVSVGPVNLTFNWEGADENHYRNNGVLTRANGHALQPGKTQAILFKQQGSDAVVYVNDREVYRTKAILSGTVTIYSAEHGVIAVSEIDIKGKADPTAKVGGPSHKLNY